jgi:hypothetical protein
VCIQCRLNAWAHGAELCPGAHKHRGSMLIYVCCVLYVFLRFKILILKVMDNRRRTLNDNNFSIECWNCSDSVIYIFFSACIYSTCLCKTHMHQRLPRHDQTQSLGYYHHIASSVVCKSLTLTLEGWMNIVYQSCKQ